MSRPAVVNHLVDHLTKCLVLIDGLQKGSGFFIAPNTIATCAHVAGPGGAAVTVVFREREWPGVVRWASAPDRRERITPYPDVAIVEVDLPVGSHHSVLLDDHRAASDTELVAAGHSSAATGSLAPLTTSYTHRGEHAEFIRLTDDVVAPGMSGGPVLNTVTGGVCGITKAASRTGQPAAGGFAVPVRALREVIPAEPYRVLRRMHDGFHSANRTWTNLADELPDEDPAVVPGWAERELRRILGTLPAAGHDEHLDDYRTIAGDPGATVRPPLHDHGDVVAELAGLSPPEDRFPRVLAYALHRSRTAGTTIADRLTRWAVMAARTPENRERVRARSHAAVPAPDPAPAPALTSVLVHVQPSGPNQQRYRCEIWRHDGVGITPLDVEGPDRSVDELHIHLRDTLPDLIRVQDGEKAPMIELVLPFGLLDEAVERWPRSSRRRGSLIGQRNPVVVRELERFELAPDNEDDREVLATWQARWDALAAGPVGAAVLKVDCDEKRDDTALYAELELHPVLGALVLPDTPQRRPELRTVLDVGIWSGLPIMAWRRDGCAGEADVAHDNCAGALLAAAVTEALADAGRDDVPDRIMRLRNEAGAKGHPECGNDIVLFWDDPRRRLRRSPMTPPREGAGG
jgi:hypothetical protein